MQVIFIEPTPNPNALKFNVDGVLLAQGSRNFASPAEANGDALAASLFGIAGVTNVFYTGGFLSITKQQVARWETIQPAVEEVVAGYTPAKAAPVAQPAGAPQCAAPSADESPDTARILSQVQEVIEMTIAPALAGDGGGVRIVGLDGWTLKINYQGACGGCPSSTAGTLDAIGRMIKEEVDQRLEVVNV